MRSNAGAAYAWPEDDVEVVASKPPVGVAFSGGGTRSYAASAGVAPLEALGLLSKIKYMSGVSGGSSVRVEAIVGSSLIVNLTLA